MTKKRGNAKRVMNKAEILMEFNTETNTSNGRGTAREREREREREKERERERLKRFGICLVTGQSSASISQSPNPFEPIEKSTMNKFNFDVPIRGAPAS